ncbi:MAG TPA: 3' terminal RNA ribose 2'-O-methyltransferase Hen1 [Streptosporangiaceae bacterium]|jgi:3' terminal RNA ribose 2'-O-methyltransferase Hen1
MRHADRGEALLLTIATSHVPATDLGYLLHKNPAGHYTAELSLGTAHVFYPVAAEDRCEAAVVLDIDPVGLVRRGRPEQPQFSLARYVTDRPYVASSMMSVALGRLFATALSGRSKERPALAATPLPLEIGLPVVPCRGGKGLLQRVFGPLGYDVTAEPIALDETFPDWGDSQYLSVRLTGLLTVREALEHLFVLLPVLDDDKHYWAGSDEVDKLLRRAGAWLAAHPDRELITRRYLRHDRRLTTDALRRLTADEGTDPDSDDAASDAAEEAAERRVGLHDQRIAAVVAAIAASGAARVLDLGCGSGKLIAALLKLGQIQQVTGMDVSHHALEAAARWLHLDQLSPRARARVELLHGSLTYTDDRLRGYDAAAVVEVIEHLDPPRLGAFELSLFGFARPAMIVVTTPNAEYNVLFDGLPAGTFRHADHRFEWTRAQFGDWAAAVASRHGYDVTLAGVGPEDPAAGCPSQLAVFRR